MTPTEDSPTPQGFPRAVQNGMSKAEYDTWLFLGDKEALDDEYTYAVKQSDLTKFVRECQLQLVSELEGVLPNKKDEHPMEDGVPVEVYGYEAEYNSAIDAVKAVLEHKKQELEGNMK